MKKGDHAAPDTICLAGRVSGDRAAVDRYDDDWRLQVHKDKFINSGYEDREALNRAIEWYRRAFELSPAVVSRFERQ